MDVENQPQRTDGEDVEEPVKDVKDGNDSDASSVFSERHMEGPRSLHRPGTNGLTPSVSRSAERVNTFSSQTLSNIRSRAQQPPFSHPLVHEKTSTDVIVNFEGPDDPYHPLNWPTNKKVLTTIFYGLTTLTTTFSSSISSTASRQISHEFHVGVEVATLTTALFIFAMGLGPMFFAPISEVYGRKPAVLLPVFIAGLFAFAAGTGKDIQTVIICRFFQGLFGSAPVTNTGGVLGDVWSPQQRGAAILIYSVAVVGGPTVGPLIGNAIIVNTTWRWTQYLCGIFTLIMVFLDVLILDESYPNALLVTKARRLRIESGNWALHAKHEEWDVSIAQMAHKYMVRPFQLLATPICFLMALYASFVYGILYATLAAFPVEFQEVRGWSPVVASLPFLCIVIGVMIGMAVNFVNNTYYIKRMNANNKRPVPEARLPPMMIGSIFFASGLFMFAWSSDKSIFWLVPCIGIVLFGFGFFVIFQSALNYLIDTFQRYSASAVAANTFLRSVFAGAFPLFVTQQLHAMGIGWGISVYAFVGCLLLPVPFVFFVFGRRLRAKGEWSRESTL